MACTSNPVLEVSQAPKGLNNEPYYKMEYKDSTVSEQHCSRNDTQQGLTSLDEAATTVYDQDQEYVLPTLKGVQKVNAPYNEKLTKAKYKKLINIKIENHDFSFKGSE